MNRSGRDPKTPERCEITDTPATMFAPPSPLIVHLTPVRGNLDSALCSGRQLPILRRSRHSFRTRQQARTGIFDWIEAWYNRERRHSRLDYHSPDQYERDYERNDCATETDEEIFIEEQAKLPNVCVSTKPGRSTTPLRR
jgi:hypothetical protein